MVLVLVLDRGIVSPPGGSVARSVWREACPLNRDNPRALQIHPGNLDFFQAFNECWQGV